MQSRSMEPHYYDPGTVSELCQDLFGLDPLWLPISPLTRRVLRGLGDYGRIAGTDWIPPLGRRLDPQGPPARTGVGAERTLVLGRHSRDHATKWPGTPEDLRGAYCADVPGIEVRLMGGVRTPKKMLRSLPGNWKTTAFDEVPVTDFIAGLDFFTHFISDDYIEEFGRNIMEAMAAGVPVILPAVFRETFGEAAVYCAPSEVAETMRRLWAVPETWHAQAARGHAYVLRHSDTRAVMNRMGGFIERRTAAAEPAA
jgi:glycosyltransferase involved in cell wall biosynthesis